ncbi:chemotaxis protein [Clostridium oryzae]|uniref:Stage 0 sporulation protein A homolog n=1 Tax=Clostridium oryzae TaxID=1450648 RepID=A0A1V4IR80_9CLOT|nr:chemotaxis protein [Clostridium oryzae]OPJ62389.1 chemotaxis protein CheV [Clostridium oryzae]
METNILLESGTGELEILEFLINSETYAINVIKVKEVLEIKAENITKLPQTHPAIAGVTVSRGKILTLIDLKYVLDKTRNTNDLKKVIVCEFNKLEIAFIIDSVTKIQRIKWEEIVKPDDLTVNSLVIGNIIFKDKIVSMLDYEKIVTDISPNSGINQDRIANVNYKDRADVKIAVADDSQLIRKLLFDTLTKAGFKNIRTFDDGKQVLDYLNNLVNEKADKFDEDIQLLITDIEMPQMDGHTLTRRIKENPILNKLPVIIFSSLITGDLKHKGESVGADAQLSKPEVEDLVDVITKLLNKENI